MRLVNFLAKIRRPILRLRRWLAASIANRIAGVSLAVAAVLVFALGSLSYVFTQAQFKREALAGLETRGELISAKLSTVLNQASIALSALARNPLVANTLLDSEGRRTYLEPFLQEYKLFSGTPTLLTLHDHRGRIVASTGLVDRRTAVAESIAMRTVELGKSYAQLTGTVQSRMLVIAVPVVFRTTGTVEGSLALSVDLTGLASEAAKGVTGEAALALLGAGDRMLAGEVFPRSGWILRDTTLQLSEPLASLDIKVRVGVTEDEVYSPLRYLALLYLLVGLVALVASWTMSRVAANRVALPLSELSRIAGSVGRMGLSARESLPERPDEIGRLASAFNVMLAELHTADEQIKEALIERTRRLEWTEQRLENVVSGLQDISWSWDPQTRKMISIGQGIERATGFGPEAFAATADLLESVTHPEDRSVIRAALSGLRPGVPLAIGFRMRADGGQWRWFSSRLSGNFDRSGRLESVDGVTSDVTDLRIAEQSARSRAQQLNEIFRMSPDGFVVIGRSGEVLQVNPAILGMLGCEESELVGLSTYQLDRLFVQRLAQGEAYQPMSSEASLEAPSSGAVTIRLGSPRNMVVSRVRVQASEAESGSIYYFRDVTREAAIDRMKSEFLTTAAHELRTPLSSILGFSELLLSREFDEATRKDLVETIHRQSQSLTRLVSELLDLARIEAQSSSELKIERLDVPQFLADLLKSQVAVDGRRVSLPEVPQEAVILADRQRLELALNNVISNAFKYSPPSARVSMRVLRRDYEGHPGVEILVDDEGQGMTVEQVDRVFERFYRADPMGTIAGSGLGMSIVKEVMDLLGGKVALRSSPGIGTTVSLWLPSPQDSGASSTEAALRSSSAG